jgi:hypothetical protein
MANTYLSAPLTWEEIRVQYPNQDVVLRDPEGTVRAFSTARVVLGSNSHAPALPGRFSSGHLVYDTSEEAPDPAISTTIGVVRSNFEA